MYKTVVLSVLFFLPFSLFGSEKSFVINKPALTIVKELKANSDNHNFSIPPDAIKALKLADLSFDLYARPQHGYYKLTINLENDIRRLNGFEKTLEVWSQPNRTVVRSTVNIDFGRQHSFPLRWVDCLKEKLIKQIEEKILEYEKQKILEIAQ